MVIDLQKQVKELQTEVKSLLLTLHIIFGNKGPTEYLDKDKYTYYLRKVMVYALKLKGSTE